MTGHSRSTPIRGKWPHSLLVLKRQKKRLNVNFATSFSFQCALIHHRFVFCAHNVCMNSQKGKWRAKKLLQKTLSPPGGSVHTHRKAPPTIPLLFDCKPVRSDQ